MDGKATRLTQSRYDRQAALFDLTEAPSEFLVFGRMRRRLWRDVEAGRLLEVGVGTGKNMRYYPDGARVVAIDLSPRMVRKAVAKARRLGREVDLVIADAQRLPFRDGAFDGAAATFVFCSVPDPIAGLSEVRRVVRAGGRVDLLEHVRANLPVVGGLMDLLNPLVVRMMGANINRDTVGNVGRAGIGIDEVASRFGIIKLIRGRRAAVAADRPAGSKNREVMSDVA
ncbi:MAG TPA: class I SAM-dependent methyltransferase [Dehalococcoidia bacterium]|nr:class I SAM-dependent methyltransferase [Dehalococcoidia bacterium]